MRTLDEWEEFIRIRWMESVGASAPETYSVTGNDMGMLFYKAIYKYRRARDESDEIRKAAILRQSSQAAGQFVNLAVERGSLESIRNLYLAMDRVNKGDRARSDGHAKSAVGSALLNFLLAHDRLPRDREELRNHATGTASDLAGVTRRNLADALVHYSLNKLIRDKTGPKPAN